MTVPGHQAAALAPATPRARPEAESAAEYLPLVERVARRMVRRLPSHVRVEDLVSAGVVGLLEAMERFDPARPTEFERFAEFRIKGAILDELRRRDLMARDARVEAKAIERALEQLAAELGREPEEAELASHLGLSVDDLRQKLGRLTPVTVVSLDDLTHERLEAVGASPFEETAKRELHEQLAVALDKLSERHQLVLQLYYVEEFTLRQVGEVLEVTESRVCQILSEATLRLRTFLKLAMPDLVMPTRRGGEDG